jgi:hypothetical protein
MTSSSVFSHVLLIDRFNDRVIGLIDRLISFVSFTSFNAKIGLDVEFGWFLLINQFRVVSTKNWFGCELVHFLLICRD